MDFSSFEHSQDPSRILTLVEKLLDLETQMLEKPLTKVHNLIVIECITTTGKYHFRMSGRNYGICHSCRVKDHLFAECKKKRPFTRCKQGFEKCFVVEKNNSNKGKLFLCCSRHCEFWDWVVKDASTGQSSTETFHEPVGKDTDDEISRVFKSRVQISDEDEL